MCGYMYRVWIVWITRPSSIARVLKGSILRIVSPAVANGGERVEKWCKSPCKLWIAS